MTDDPKPWRADLPPILLVLLAWVLPGLGHFLLGRRVRSAAFFLLIVFSATVGVVVRGHLFRPESGQPLAMLGMLASMGSGVVDFTLRFGLRYVGQPEAAGYEYGTAFLLTAGLMNLLLLLDVWDLATGRKE